MSKRRDLNPLSIYRFISGTMLFISVTLFIATPPLGLAVAGLAVWLLVNRTIDYRRRVEAARLNRLETWGY